MSSNEIKHELRKLQFPNSVKEALLKIDQMFGTNHVPSNRQLDLAMDLISEFIFCEADPRAGRRGCMFTSIQELQLALNLTDYLNRILNETARNSIFLLLFGGAESQRRLRILYLLTSMSMTRNYVRILVCVGVWLQQTGCITPQSLELAEKLVVDQFALSCPKYYLKAYARRVPRFVANLMMSITEVYFRECNGKVKIAPKNLVEILAFWVYEYPEICQEAQMHSAALPVGAIPMPATNPLAGLINFCCLAPLYVKEFYRHELDENNEIVKKEIVEPKQEFPKNIFAVKMETKPIPELPEPKLPSVFYEEKRSRSDYYDPDYKPKRMKIEEQSVFIKYDLPLLDPKPEKTDEENKAEIPKIETEDELYSKLLFGIINNLREAHPKKCPQAVNAQHISSMVPPIQVFVKKLVKKGEVILENPRLQECTERMAQLLQMSLEYGCIYGNLNSMLASLNTLPDCRALKMVIKHHQDSKKKTT